MAVKTPGGLTNRQVLRGTHGGLSLPLYRLTKLEGHSYLCKNCLPVGFLGLVDDIIGVTEDGLNGQKMNAVINIKTA